MLFDGFYNVHKFDLCCKSVTVVDDWLIVRTVPAVHCSVYVCMYVCVCVCDLVILYSGKFCKFFRKLSNLRSVNNS